MTIQLTTKPELQRRGEYKMYSQIQGVITDLPYQLLAAAILLLLELGLGYVVVLAPRIHAYQILQQKEDILTRQLERRQHQLVEFTVAPKQLLHVENLLKRMWRHFPPQNAMPSLLEDISSMGRTSGLIFELFAPKSEQSEGLYRALPIQLVLVGTYHQLFDFLGQLAQRRQVLTVHDFSLGVQAQKEISMKRWLRKSPLQLLRMSLLVTVYWMNHRDDTTMQDLQW